MNSTITFLILLHFLSSIILSSFQAHAHPLPHAPDIDSVERDDEELYLTPDPTPTSSSGEESGFPLGAIIGIAAGGGLLLIILIVVLCVVCLRRRRGADGEEYQTFGEWRADRKLTSLDIPRRKAQAAQAAFQQQQLKLQQEQQGSASTAATTGVATTTP